MESPQGAIFPWIKGSTSFHHWFSYCERLYHPLFCGGIRVSLRTRWGETENPQIGWNRYADVPGIWFFSLYGWLTWYGFGRPYWWILVTAAQSMVSQNRRIPGRPRTVYVFLVDWWRWSRLECHSMLAGWCFQMCFMYSWYAGSTIYRSVYQWNLQFDLLWDFPAMFDGFWGLLVAQAWPRFCGDLWVVLWAGMALLQTFLWGYPMDCEILWDSPGLSYDIHLVHIHGI